MAVPQQQPFVQYATNGIATAFAIPFRLIRDDDLGVYLDGVKLTSGFNISGVGSNVGQITFTVAPSPGVLALNREVPLERLTDYQTNGDLLAGTVNLDFDRLWCALQDMNYDRRRALLRAAFTDYFDATDLQIKNVADPTEDMDVANKRWVSQFLATLIGGLVIGPVGAASAVVYTDPAGQARTVQDLSGARGSSLIGYSASSGIARTAEAKLREIASRPDYASDAAFVVAAAGKPSIDADGNLDAPIKKTNGEVTTLRTLASQPAPQAPAVNVHIPSHPALIDQFIDGFFGRGMLTSEVINVTTERAITASASKGQNIIGVANTNNLIIGGGLVVLHADGKYWPYIITSMTANSITVFPALRADVNSNSRLERLWYNRAHPGKFYMRYLAQRIAHGKEFENPIVRGRRIAFVEYGSGTTVALGGLTVTSGVTLNYYPAAPTGASGTVTTPPRFTFETTALAEFAAGTAGYAQTGLFAVRDYNSVTAVLTVANDRPIRVTVLDENNRALAYKVIDPVFISTNYLGHRRVKFSFFTGNAANVRFRFESASSNPAALAVASIEAFENQETQGRLVAKSNAVIVGLGDSWIGGDVVNTPERESIMTQLALELPNATVINAGIGGNKIDQMLARFDTDVTPHNPDYVVVNTGTNEAYNPASATFDPTATGIFVASYLQLIGKIQSIGARPILLGPPALAQSDAEVPALGEWELLNRSRLQYIRLMRALSDRPNAS